MTRKRLYWMAGLVFLTVLVCYILNVYFMVSNVVLSIMLVATGLITFYGAMGGGLSDRKLSKYDIRLAIVLSLITVYIVLVGTVVFFKRGSELPPIAQTMITHFTTIIGVVIAFYFGAEAYEAVNKPAVDSSDTTDTATDEETTK